MFSVEGKIVITFRLDPPNLLSVVSKEGCYRCMFSIVGAFGLVLPNLLMVLNES